MLVRLALAAAFVVGLPRPDFAQTGTGGTATMHMTGRLPDSLKARLPLGIGMDSIDMTVTYATDGNRVGMRMQMNTAGAVPGLSGMTMHMIYTPGADTLRLGILLPPETAAMMGGGTGIEMDLPLSTIGAVPPGILDSAMTRLAAGTSARARNTASVVAGVRCEDWDVIVAGDTTRQCLVATPTIVATLQQRLLGSPAFSQLQGILGMATTGTAKLFGGRAMTAIRSVGRTMHAELTDFKPGTPDPALLTLPAGLKPMGAGMPGFGG